MKGMLRNGVLGVVVATAMGFGATQALAAPDNAARRACEPWNEAPCIESCQAQGYDTGTCSYGATCKCWYW